MLKKKALLILLISLIVSIIACHNESEFVLKDQIRTVTDTCISAFKTHYVYPEKVAEIGKFLQNKLADDRYNDKMNLTMLTRKLRHDFRKVLNDRHIWIDVMENLPVKDANVSDQEKINELKKTNFGFVKFEQLPDNIAYLRLDGFKDLKYARETATQYMQKLANSEIIILDLRENHGGNGNMVRFLSSYFFEHKTQLNSLYFREKDSLATSWTDPGIPGQKLIHQKLVILTSKNTTSAAEAFTYSMKHYQRATIIGETTRGAGHWKESFQYPQLGIFLEIPVARPINPVTNTGWEHTGISPEIKCRADEALEIALKFINKVN
jgi:hypothetical protein